MRCSFILIFLLSGCSNLTLYQPTGIQEIPEIADTSPGGSLDIGTVPTVEYNATSDASARPFKFDASAKAGRAHFARIRFPLEQEDIEFGGGIYSTAGFFGTMKYQFWGQRLGRAIEGDTSLAIVGLASISATSTRTGSGKGETSGTYPWESKIFGTNAGASLLYGYRLKDEILFYGGPYISYSNIQADVNQSQATDGSSASTDARLTDYMLRYGPTLGMLFKLAPKISMHLEGYFLFTTLGQPIKVVPESGVSMILRYDDFIKREQIY